MLSANASTYIYYQRRVPWFNNSTFFFQIGRYHYYYYYLIWYSFLNYKEPQEKLRDDLSHVSARRRQFMDMVVSRRQTRQVFIKLRQMNFLLDVLHANICTPLPSLEFYLSNSCFDFDYNQNVSRPDTLSIKILL